MENVEKVIHTLAEKKIICLCAEAQDFFLTYLIGMKVSDIKPKDIHKLETELTAFDFQNIGEQDVGFLNPFYKNHFEWMVARALVAHDFQIAELDTMVVLYRVICEKIQFAVMQ